MRLAVYWQGRVWRSSNELTPEQFAREQAKWESMGIVAVESLKQNVPMINVQGTAGEWGHPQQCATCLHNNQ